MTDQPPLPSHDQTVRGVIAAPFRYSIAVGSGKGGVGKTTVAVNLAVDLASRGYAVGLLDADIYGPNVPLMMGLDHLPQQSGEKILPATAYGVRVISIGLFPGIQADQPLIWRGPMLHKAIRQFISDVEWGELDILIVDLPPGTGDAGLSVAQSIALTGGVIVTLPQQVSLDDARRGLEMYRQLNVPVLGVVENMSYLELPGGGRFDVFGSGGGQKLARESGVPFLGSIPMDPNVRLGSDEGRPVVNTFPDSAVSISLREISTTLLERIEGLLPAGPGPIQIDLH